MVDGTPGHRINLDDIVVQPYTTAEATVTLSNLAQIYDGTAKSATITTDPVGLAVSVTYDGLTASPTSEGSYEVIAIVTATGYSGGSTGALVIASAIDPFDKWLTDRSLDPVNTNYAESADVDLDGMTTWEEYLADTDPTVAGSVLELTGTYFIVSATNGTGKILLSFPASTGRYYQLVYSTNLFGGTITSNLGWGIPGMVITNAP